MTDSRIDVLFGDIAIEEPGCAVGVVRGGELIHAAGYGLAELDSGRPLGPRSLVYLASVSKQFTAACVMHLRTAGALALEDDVRRFVPELPDYGARISIAHLLHHTSGLRDFLELWEMAGHTWDEPLDQTGAVALILAQPALNFAPGERHLYCNSGYKLLALLVERASGESLRRYAERHLFGPLGMTETWFDDDNAPHPERAVSYRRDNDGWLPVAKAFSFVGSGGLLSTVSDLARWAAAPTRWEPLLERGRLNDGTVLEYAGGLVHGCYQGLPTIGHGGGMLGFRTMLLRFASQDLAVIVLGNRADLDAGERARRVADLLLAEAFPLAELAGAYACRELGCVWRLEARDGGLWRIAPGPAARLVSVSRDSWRLAGCDVRVDRPTGSALGLLVSGGRTERVRFDRIGS